jgi:hypothetical protein
MVTHTEAPSLRGELMTITSSLRAWHGDPQVKARALAKVAAHRAADELVRGTYWDGRRGSAVGCLLEDPEGGHARYETEFGIPRVLAWLEDRIFEGLPHGHAATP